jgi:hypothetical protein
MCPNLFFVCTGFSIGGALGGGGGFREKFVREKVTRDVAEGS